MFAQNLMRENFV